MKLKHMTKKIRSEMNTRHRKWPLGTLVIANTPIGRLSGRVFKHWLLNEVAAGCTIDFGALVDLGDASGSRYCHIIPFRNLRKLSRKSVK